MTVHAVTSIAGNPEVSHAEMANAIRFLAIDAVEKAKSGHPGMPMGMADVATVLFSRFLKFDPADPAWPDRDRFVLSAGHGSMLLYALLHLTGREHKTVAIRPCRIGRIEFEETREQHGRDIGHAHRHPRMTGPGFLDGVDRQEADRVGHLRM